MDESTLVPDESLSIDQGAVAPWQTLMWSLIKDIAREMGVRTDVPFRELTAEKWDIVFHSPTVKKNIIYQNKTSGVAGDMDFTYFNATYTVENALSKVKDERAKLVRQRLQVLKDLGLGYLTLGEETPSLSGGKAQRLKLVSEMGRTQSESLFVFDEPTIGLHPLDVRTLLGMFQALIGHGATVVVIEHDLDVIRNADYLIDTGPGGGETGGYVVAAGTPEEVAGYPESVTGQYLKL